MPTLLVSGAGLGDSSLFGSLTAANKAFGVFPLGLPPPEPGSPIVSPNVPGRAVNFDFVVAQTQTADNVRLDFNTTRPVMERGWDSAAFGTTSVVNKSFGAQPPGWDSASVGTPLVSFNLLGRAVNFNFTIAFTQSASNVGLYFDGKPIVIGAGLGSQTFFGVHEAYNTARVLLPVGIPPLDPFLSVYFTGTGRSVNFNFVADYAPLSGQAVRLDFSSNRPIPIRGLDATVFGSATVVNKAFGVSPGGIDSLRIGASVVSRDLFARNVSFDFVDPYTPDTGLNIAFAFGEKKSIKPDGWDSRVVGQPNLFFHYTWYVRPYGPDVLEFGEHSVTHRNRAVFPVGQEQFVAGTAFLSNLQRSVRPVSVTDEALGEPTVRTLRQIILVVAGPDMAAFGLPKVVSSIGLPQTLLPRGFEDSVFGPASMIAYQLRRIVLIDTVEQLKMGEPYIGYRVRYIEVPWSSFTQWGLPVFGHHPHAEPFGWEDSAFGQPKIFLANLHYFQGFDTLEMGEPEVKLMRRYLQVANWDEKDKFGDPTVFNRRQYLLVDNKQYFDYVPYMGVADVRNRNRSVFPQSWPSSKFPITHRARLTGQQVLPLGEEHTQWGEHMVAYRIRHLYPSWRFAGFVDPYHFVHNYAIRIEGIGGIDSMQFGLHRVWFNAQHIAPRFIKQDAYGTPFIADRVRWLHQADTESPLKVGTHWVSLGTRYIVEAPWDPPYLFGTPTLRTHKNILNAFSIGYNEYGRPFVHNVTPQLYPNPVSDTGFGLTWVSHSPRELKPDLIPTTEFASPVVLFRDRLLPVPSIAQWHVPGPVVRQQYADQVVNQTIFVDGIEPPQPERPSLNFPPYPDGWDSQEIPAPWVRLQGCTPHWFWPDSLYGFGIPIINRAAQRIKDVSLAEQTKWPSPYTRVSPHTIWCTYDTPLQAIENNPQSRETWHAIDSLTDVSRTLPPWFGHPSVTTPSLQYVQHYHGIYDTTVGDLMGADVRVESTIRTIYVDGTRHTKYGYPTLPHPEHLWVGNYDFLEFGDARVGFRPFYTHHVSGVGFDSQAFGQTQIELKNRPVYVQGFSATEYGDNLPMVYHKPRGPKGVSGTDMAEIGPDTWISHWTRELQVEGFESFEEGYSYGSFNDRMRVIKGPARPSISIGDSLQMGTPFVDSRQATQYIRPYMIPPPQYCHPHSVTEG